MNTSHTWYRHKHQETTLFVCKVTSICPVIYCVSQGSINICAVSYCVSQGSINVVIYCGSQGKIIICVVIIV